MFSIGDMVCYPMHGVGVVEAIQEQTILGETCQYYLLRFIMGRMTAMVPAPAKAKTGISVTGRIWISSRAETSWWWPMWSSA